jgi:hypothetical protein
VRFFLFITLLAGFAVNGFSANLSEDFTSNPLNSGWRTFGDASLFQWNENTKVLDVKWDSEKVNSCFFKSLPNVLHKDDDFSISFEIRPKSVAVQFNRSRSYAFEIFAVGLISTNTSFLPNFDRSTGTDSPNLAEFDYFPDTGFRETVSPVLVSSNSAFGASFLFPAPLDNGIWYQVTMVYTATNQLMKTTAVNETSLQTYQTSLQLPEGFTDYSLNALSITSYQDNDSTGSMLAEGSVRNLSVTFPNPPLILKITNGLSQTSLTFSSRTNRYYSIEGSGTLKNWNALSSPVLGNEAKTEIQLPATPTVQFFRVLEQKQ